MGGKVGKDKLRITAWIVPALVLSICAGSRLFATTTSEITRLRILSANGKVIEYRPYSETEAKLLFPNNEAQVAEALEPERWKLRAAPILQKVHLLKISDMDHRFIVAGAAYGERLFIFDQLFCGENPSVMNELIRSSNSAPRNSDEALDLVKIYLSLAYYRLDDPHQFVASEANNIPPKINAGLPSSFWDLVEFSHAPEVAKAEKSYDVDLFAYTDLGIAGGPVIRWKIDIGAADFNVRMLTSKKWDQEAPVSPANAENRGEGKIRFTRIIMANGISDDGAMTDIQHWSASDGPGLYRVHFYYASSESAKRRMQGFLKKSISVIEQRPWTYADGRVAGEQVLETRLADDIKPLLASALYSDEKSVVELSCPCLRNLQAFLSTN